MTAHQRAQQVQTSGEVAARSAGTIGIALLSAAQFGAWVGGT